MKLLATLLMLLFPVAAAQAAVQTRTVEYKAGETTLVGLLAWDDAIATEKTPAPGVLVCPEWWGNNEYAHSRAKQLAELGYVALAIDMYGRGEDGKAKTTSDPKVAGEWAGSVYKDPKVLIERVTAGYYALKGHMHVDAKKTAAIGYCMGGTVALSLARTGADLKAVVAFHASNIAASGDEAAALAANGKIKATVLICHGQDDAFVKAGELDTFHAQMKAAKVDYVLSSYSGAVHAFTNPKADEYKVPGVAYNKNADRRSWDAMKALFSEKFGSGFARGARQGLREGIDAALARKVPAPLTDAQIAAMTERSVIVDELTERLPIALARQSLDSATRDRLMAECDKLKKRLAEVAPNGAPK